MSKCVLSNCLGHLANQGSASLRAQVLFNCAGVSSAHGLCTPSAACDKRADSQRSGPASIRHFPCALWSHLRTSWRCVSLCTDFCAWDSTKARTCSCRCNDLCALMNLSSLCTRSLCGLCRRSEATVVHRPAHCERISWAGHLAKHASAVRGVDKLIWGRRLAGRCRPVRAAA